MEYKFISSNTDIWLDFHIISKIDLPFKLPCTFIMYKEGLRKQAVCSSNLIEILQEKGLVGVELTTDEFFYAEELASKYVKLSIYDRTALAIAKLRGIPLMTGDHLLEKAASQEGVAVLGTINLLDRLFEGDYIHKLEYQFCLKCLLEHKERCLPAEELQKRLDSLQ